MGENKKGGLMNIISPKSVVEDEKSTKTVVVEDEKSTTTVVVEDNKSSTPKVKNESFTMTIHPETLELFNEIQWLKEYAIDFKSSTRNEVLKAALESYGKEIGYNKLKKRYKDKMKGSIGPKSGRPSTK